MKNDDLLEIELPMIVSFISAAEFGAFNWSPDKTKLVYIAEKKLPKSAPFYRQTAQESTAKTKAEEEETTKVQFSEYLWKRTCEI